MSPLELRIRGLTVVHSWTRQSGGRIRDCADCDRHRSLQKWHSSPMPHSPADPHPGQIVSAKGTGH